MRRRLDLALAGVLVVLVVVGALRWVDGAAYPLVVLQRTGPFVVIGLLLLALVAALLRRWLLLAPTAVAVVVSLAIALPGFFSSASPKATKDLTVMAANLHEGHADAAQVMEAVRARAVDVLVLIEVTPEAVEGLRAAGLEDHFTEETGEARPSSVAGTLVFSRFPLDPLKGESDRESANLEPAVTVEVNGTAVLLKAIHVPAPDDGRAETWHEELRTLGEWRAAQQGPLVMAGDFNADCGHPAFRSVADGLTDAHREAGLGWVRTWPVVGQRLPPYTQPDHLLSRGLTVVEAGQVALHGTDHAVVWASYALTTDG